MNAAASDHDQFQVVVNHEEQYSVWPAASQPPDGWRPSGHTGSREDCLAHIERVWTDITPKSARERAAERADAP